MALMYRKTIRAWSLSLARHMTASVSPTVMKGLKSMKQAMKQVTNAEMNDLPPRLPMMR